MLRRLIGPLERLTAVARDIGAGRLDRRVGVHGQDEIGRLASAFDTMAERLEAAERRRRDLVSDVAHELRTPLTNLQGQLEAVLDGVVALDIAVVGSLHEEALLLARLVDDLQVLSLADAGQLDLAFESVSVSEQIAHVIGSWPPSAGGPRVEVTIDDELPRARADAVRLRQILGNLLSNAVRYARSEVRLTARAVPHGIELAVHDDGSGIAADALPLIFDRFYRSDPSRRRDTGGAGLGLAIVRQLVLAHDGSIEAESDVERGTTIRVRLPGITSTAEQLAPKRDA